MSDDHLEDVATARLNLLLAQGRFEAEVKAAAAAHITQVRIAEAAGMSRQRISQIIRKD